MGACRSGAQPGDGPLFHQLSSPSTQTAPPIRVVGGDEEAIVAVVDQVLPAVVNVRADFGGGEGGEGTGFVIRSDGVIVTNFHVVAGPARSR